MKQAEPPVNPRILVAPLDWGLGHATRCIPLIACLLEKGADVWLAGSGPGLAILQTHFPTLPVLHLPSYGVHYANSRWATYARLLQQLPKLLRTIKNENAWLQRAVITYGFNAVIADNRYGLYHPQIQTVFITHQLQVQTPVPLVTRLLQKKLYGYINRFSACWVPDAAGDENLAGALAHPRQKPKVPLHYVGWLSRFQPATERLTPYVLVMLSGPEPQRTRLEELILAQLPLFKNPLLVVRGLPAATSLPTVPYHALVVNHLPAATLKWAIDSAALVISRPGYSTVMELWLQQKKCVFVPTPAQTEQAYLARYLQQKKSAPWLAQKNFSLDAAVQKAEQFAYQFTTAAPTDALAPAVEALLQKLQTQHATKEGMGF